MLAASGLNGGSTELAIANTGRAIIPMDIRSAYIVAE
jgi:hypothetical protein